MIRSVPLRRSLVALLLSCSVLVSATGCGDKGDPLLSKAVAPLTAGIESLKGMAAKLRNGEAGEGDIGAFESVVHSIKNAGRSAGAEVADKVPSTSQLTG